MRLVAGLVAVILAAPLAARADDAPPPAAPEAKPEAKAARVPLRVVRVMPESNQALLFDRLRNTHVLAEVGGTVSGYQVEDITDDEVTLSIFGRQVVLAAPLRNHRTGEGRRNRVRTASAHGDTATPVDPYGDDAAADAGPRDANDAGDDAAPDARSDAAPAVRKPAAKPHVRSATPTDPYEEPVRVAEAPGAPRAPAQPTDPDEEPVRVAEAPGAGPHVVEAPDVAAPRGPEAPDAAAPRVIEAPAAPTSAPRAVEAPDATAPRVVEAPAKRPAKGHKPTKSTAKQPRDAAGQRDVAELFADAATATPPAAANAPPAASATPTPAASTPATAAKPAAPPARPGPITLSRSEVDRALADFGRLADAIHGSFTAAGVKVDGVAEGSLFERIGLRAGDTIAQVNGIVPRTLDDAANIYALASSVKTMTVLIARDGKQSALRVAIQ